MMVFPKVRLCLDGGCHSPVGNRHMFGLADVVVLISYEVARFRLHNRIIQT